MSAAGPELPPHLLAKRKRQQQDDQKPQSASSSGANHDSPKDKRQKTAGPEPPQSSSPAPLGPSLPPPSASPPADPTLPSREPTPHPARPIAGPAPPPAPLDERPTAPPDSDSDSDDGDDFGPALPSAADLTSSSYNAPSSIPQPAAPAPARAQRDEWMTLPPQQDDLAARMDPSKMRARGFNTGKNARGGNTAPAGGNIAAAWTETPEEKLKRLQNEAMGVKPSSTGHLDAKEAARNKEKEAEARRIREQTNKARGPSLMQQHRESNHQDKEDDPSKRTFDREKDIGGSSLGLVDKNDLLNKASNFGSKFSGGGYL